MRPKNIKACITRLNALRKRSELGPEQKAKIDRCISRIRALGRRNNPSEHEIYSCIEEITEELIDALFIKR